MAATLAPVVYIIVRPMHLQHNLPSETQGAAASSGCDCVGTLLCIPLTSLSSRLWHSVHPEPQNYLALWQAQGLQSGRHPHSCVSQDVPTSGQASSPVHDRAKLTYPAQAALDPDFHQHVLPTLCLMAVRTIYASVAS